jgi:transcription elongation factor SPT6
LARVVAVSWGKGDPQKDAITVVYLDGNGALRDNLKLDNLIDTQNKDLFKDLIARRDPAVIVVGGLSIRTTELVRTVKGIVSQQTEDMGGFDNSFASPPQVKVIYAFDEVARIYQHSKRADEEFSALSLAAKYCVGIARYVQSPINEYAALGEDLAALTLDEEIQNMVIHLPACRIMNQLILIPGSKRKTPCCFGTGSRGCCK